MLPHQMENLFGMATNTPRWFMFIILFTSLYSQQCELPECHEEGKRFMGLIDKEVDPCKDFMEFACGKQFQLFEKFTEGFNETSLIKPTTYRLRLWWIRRKLEANLNEPVDNNDGKAIRMAKIYWKKCKAVNGDELLEGVRELLKKLGGWPAISDPQSSNHFNWMEFSKRSRRLGFLPSSFIHIGMNVDTAHQQEYWTRPNDTIIKLTVIKIGRPIIKSRTIGQSLGYVRIAKFLDDSSKKIPDIVEIEKAIEFGHQLDNLKCNDNQRSIIEEMTIIELQKLYPTINWIDYLSEILTEKQRSRLSPLDCVIVDICFLSVAINDVLQNTDKRIQGNYAFLTIIDDLFRPIRPELALVFTTNQVEIEQICFDSAATIFEKALDMMIARHTNDDKMNAKIVGMEGKIVEKIVSTIPQISWMDVKTQTDVLKKIEKLSFINFYPRHIFNDKYFNKLELIQNGTIQLYFSLINVFLVDHYYLQAGRPRNRYTIINDDHNHRAIIKFFHIFSPTDLIPKPDLYANRIYIPAASILTRKIHVVNELEFLNYASQGREIATALVGLINQNDNSWSKETWKQFKSRSSCRSIMVKLEHDVHSQNLLFSLIGAMEIVYKTTFDSCVDKNCGESLPDFNYTPQQLFWINSVGSDCDRKLKFRYNTMVSNSELFARDFNCSIRSQMNNPNRCTFFL